MVKRSPMTSKWSYIFAHFNQCLTCKVGNHDHASTVHVQMVYSMVKNRKIDWAKLIYDDLQNKLRLPHHSFKSPQRQTTVLYPRFFSGVIRMTYDEDDTYPPGNLPYSEIGITLLNIKRQSATDVRLRNIIHPSLILSLTAEPSGMYYFISSKSPSSFSIAKTVTNPLVSSPSCYILST